MTAAEAARERRIIAAGERHGVGGQINMLVLDVDSSVTSYGRHNRCVVFRDVSDPTLLTVREDLRGLPMTTDADRRRVARGWQRLHPKGSKLTLLSSIPYTTTSGESIDHDYRITYGKERRPR